MTEKSAVKDGAGKTVKETVARELLNGAFVAIPSNREALVMASKSFPTPGEVFGKAGARNSKTDTEHIQAIHDHALALGAIPSDDTGATIGTMGGKSVDSQRLASAKSALVATGYFKADQVGDDIAPRIIELASALGLEGATGKSIQGSLEATQDRVRDALQDANPNSYVWLRGTLPDYVVFELSEIDGPECETYKQTYTDDGATVTLTGEPVAVDLAEVVTPDADPEADASEAPAVEKDALSDEVALKYQALMFEVAAATLSVE
jgi:hypothetical protein